MLFDEKASDRARSAVFKVEIDQAATPIDEADGDKHNELKAIRLNRLRDRSAVGLYEEMPVFEAGFGQHPERHLHDEFKEKAKIPLELKEPYQAYVILFRVFIQT